VKVSQDQKCTLELLSEQITWSGRYPAPKKEGQWNNYHDNVIKKHEIREVKGSSGSVIANPKRFPSIDNYLTLWNLFKNEYDASNEQKA
jgi:hypothetical protein